MLKILFTAASIAMTAAIPNAYSQSQACYDGLIVGGTWSGTKDDPNTVADETNFYEYIDMEVEQPDGSICVIGLRYERQKDSFFWEPNEPEPENENLLARIVDGEFKVLDDGRYYFQFTDSNGRKWENFLVGR